MNPDSNKKISTPRRATSAALALLNLFKTPPNIGFHITETFSDTDAQTVASVLRDHWPKMRQDDVAFQTFRLMRLHPEMTGYTTDPDKVSTTITYVGSTEEQQEHFRTALNTMMAYITEDNDDTHKIDQALRSFSNFQTAELKY